MRVRGMRIPSACVKPWTLIDSAPIPGGGELHLFQHVREFSIRVGRGELMNSGAYGSEKALAELGFDRLGERSATRVLVGGLGMGFTTGAALRRLPADGRLTVAELIPAVVAWNRGPLAPLAGEPLNDERVAVHVGDVADLMRASVDAFDLILLDVDNGPNGMVTTANNWLYGVDGLAVAYRALRPGGVLAVWSAVKDEPFTQRLRRIGFLTELVEVRAHGSRGRRQWIWLAVRATRAQREAEQKRRSMKLRSRLAGKHR